MKMIKTPLFLLTLLTVLNITACEGGIGFGGGKFEGGWDDNGIFSGNGTSNWLELLFG